MKYRILTATTEDLLAEEVEKYLADGWVLYGDPFTHSLRGHFCQAVTYVPPAQEREYCDAYGIFLAKKENTI
jgi:hypothetical protein